MRRADEASDHVGGRVDGEIPGVDDEVVVKRIGAVDTMHVPEVFGSIGIRSPDVFLSGVFFEVEPFHSNPYTLVKWSYEAEVERSRPILK